MGQCRPPFIRVKFQMIEHELFRIVEEFLAFVITPWCIYHWGVVGTPRIHFTDFKEHTTIFKVIAILKIDCRLFDLLRDMEI